jgi:hypothetical protein
MMVIGTHAWFIAMVFEEPPAASRLNRLTET